MEVVPSLVINLNCVPDISTLVKYIKEYRMEGSKVDIFKVRQSIKKGD